MRDLTRPSLLYLKAALFLAIGLTSGGLILMERGSPRVALLLMLAIWSFCRLYYFCFYVIEKYIDPTFRFDGLVTVARHLLSRRADPRP